VRRGDDLASVAGIEISARPALQDQRKAANIEPPPFAPGIATIGPGSWIKIEIATRAPVPIAPDAIANMYMMNSPIMYLMNSPIIAQTDPRFWVLTGSIRRHLARSAIKMALDRGVVESPH
jgi:hypothetical protein